MRQARNFQELEAHLRQLGVAFWLPCWRMNSPTAENAYVYSQDSHQVPLQITGGDLTAYPGRGWSMAKGDYLSCATEALLSHLKLQDFTVLVQVDELPAVIGATAGNYIGVALGDSKGSGWGCVFLDGTDLGASVYGPVFIAYATALKSQGPTAAATHHQHAVSSRDLSVGFARHQNLAAVNIMETGRELTAYNVSPFDQSGEISYAAPDVLDIFFCGGIIRSIAVFPYPMGFERLCDLDRLIWRVK